MYKNSLEKIYYDYNENDYKAAETLLMFSNDNKHLCKIKKKINQNKKPIEKSPKISKPKYKYITITNISNNYELNKHNNKNNTIHWKDTKYNNSQIGDLFGFVTIVIKQLVFIK
jgi:hypothetical protein